MSKSAKVLNQGTHTGLRGERSLIAAKLGLTVDDRAGRNGREYVLDARRYFVDGRYHADLAALGLPPDWLPEEMEK